MAINKNHEFEELNGIKCAIVERNIPTERVEFLQSLLRLNKYEVIVVAVPPPKPAAPPPAATATEGSPQVVPEPEAIPPPSLFTLGVTDVSFNPTNAIFGRLLKTKDGHTVTLAYWQQKEDVPRDDIPYFDYREPN